MVFEEAAYDLLQPLRSTAAVFQGGSRPVSRSGSTLWLSYELAIGDADKPWWRELVKVLDQPQEARDDYQLPGTTARIVRAKARGTASDQVAATYNDEIARQVTAASEPRFATVPCRGYRRGFTFRNRIDVEDKLSKARVLTQLATNYTGGNDESEASRSPVFRCCASCDVHWLPVHAQTPRHTPQIGLLSWSPCYLPRYPDGRGQFGDLLRGLTELGYKLGETLLVTCRDADSHYDRLVAAMDELVRLPVDVIASASQPVGTYASQATKSVPIVTIISGDPVAAGLARSLAHPGGNVTGVSYYATELTAKRLELLKQMMPTMTNVGVLTNPDMAELPFEEDARMAAFALGIKISVQPAREPTDIENAIARMKAGLRGKILECACSDGAVPAVLVGRANRLSALIYTTVVTVRLDTTF